MDIIEIIPDKPKTQPDPVKIKEAEVKRLKRMEKLKTIGKIALQVSPVLAPVILHHFFHPIVMWTSIGGLILYFSFWLDNNTSDTTELCAGIAITGGIVAVVLLLASLLAPIKSVNVPIVAERYHASVVGDKLIAVLSSEEGGTVETLPTPAYKWKLVGMYRTNQFSAFGFCNGTTIHPYFVEDK